MKGLLKYVIVLALSAAVVFGARVGLAGTAAANREAEAAEMMGILLPGNASFVPETYDGEDTNITAVYKGDTGYVVETTTAGYVDDVVLWVGVSNEGKVTGLVARELHETFGLGQGALNDMDFMGQFVGTSGDAAVGENVDALTGATVTSKAVAKGVNSAVAFVTGADVSSSATEWEG